MDDTPNKLRTISHKTKMNGGARTPRRIENGVEHLLLLVEPRVFQIITNITFIITGTWNLDPITADLTLGNTWYHIVKH